MMTVELVYLEPEEGLPEIDRWVLIEADRDGGFLVSGAGQTPAGHNVYYSERAAELSAAIEASQHWCIERGITQIFVQKALR